MILPGLSSNEQAFFDHISSNDIENILKNLLASENPTNIAREYLKTINVIIQVIGKVWNEEHDMQGKLTNDKETISDENIITLYVNLKPVFEMIRSRFPIVSSVNKIAVGTFVNVHAFSEILELQLREKGFLTYYWGTELKTKDIKDKQDVSPANVFVLSCMAVNSDYNCFEELKKLRLAFPDIKIIVGGPAFQLFMVLKENKDHPALTNPYKDDLYTNEIIKFQNLKDFVNKVFNVIYCETMDDIIEEISNN